MEKNDAEAIIKDTIEYANNEIKNNKKKTRRVVTWILVVAILVIAFLISSSVSYTYFNVRNPFAVAAGCFKVVVLGKDYAEISRSPKVVIAHPDYGALTSYMEDRGFTERPKEKMGAVHFFTDGEKKEGIIYRSNAFCSKWIWKYSLPGNGEAYLTPVPTSPHLSSTPVPTSPPFTYPYVTMIDGRLIDFNATVTRIVDKEKKKTVFENAVKIGAISKGLAGNELPKKELESNCYSEKYEVYYYEAEKAYVLYDPDDENSWVYATDWYVVVVIID